jgi:hypothetical protein
MQSIQQSSRDYWEFKLFCIGVLWLALGYGLLSVTFHVLPPPTRSSEYAPIIIPIFFLLVSYVIVAAAIEVVWPITLSTDIVEDRVKFRDSRRVGEKTVVSKCDVEYFFIERRQFWHGKNFRGRVICKLKDGSQKSLSSTVVPYGSRKEFLDSIANLWGRRYVQQRSNVLDVA